MKVLDPFSFWPTYASAMSGFGGSDNGPDPSYCFHTLYQEFAPGSVTFHVSLVKAKATCGEIELRVNGYRPTSGMDAILVAGARVSLEDVSGDLEIPLRVAVLPGVSYAIFCRYTEPSDMVVASIEILAEEFADDDADTYASDALEETAFGAGERGDGALASIMILAEPELDFPRSQPFTAAQLTKGRFWSGAPDIIAAIVDPVERWRHGFAYRALQVYGFLDHGACGVLSSDLHLLTDAVAGSGALAAVQEVGAVPGFCDFMAITLPAGPDDTSAVLSDQILRAIRPVRRNGMIVVFFDCDATSSGFDDGETSNAGSSGRQMLQQIVLKMIGHGCAVAQLCLPQSGQGAPLRGRTATPFALIVRR